MKAKLMAGALAVGLVAPLTVVAGPSAFGEEEAVSASMAERLNPRLNAGFIVLCLLYTSPSPRDRTRSRMPSSA